VASVRRQRRRLSHRRCGLCSTSDARFRKAESGVGGVGNGGNGDDLSFSLAAISQSAVMIEGGEESERPMIADSISGGGAVGRSEKNARPRERTAYSKSFPKPTRRIYSPRRLTALKRFTLVRFSFTVIDSNPNKLSPPPRSSSLSDRPRRTERADGLRSPCPLPLSASQSSLSLSLSLSHALSSPFRLSFLSSHASRNTLSPWRKSGALARSLRARRGRIDNDRRASCASPSRSDVLSFRQRERRGDREGEREEEEHDRGTR